MEGHLDYLALATMLQAYKSRDSAEPSGSSIYGVAVRECEMLPVVVVVVVWLYYLLLYVRLDRS
jgi:hypothetical protein